MCGTADPNEESPRTAPGPLPLREGTSSADPPRTPYLRTPAGRPTSGRTGPDLQYPAFHLHSSPSRHFLRGWSSTLKLNQTQTFGPNHFRPVGVERKTTSTTVASTNSQNRTTGGRRRGSTCRINVVSCNTHVTVTHVSAKGPDFLSCTFFMLK